MLSYRDIGHVCEIFWPLSRLRINYRLEKIVISGKKDAYSEGTWSIAAMTCSQGGPGDMSRGVFCPESP